MSEERTEQPTGKKLRDAREKGQVARSKEVHDAFQLAAALIALTWFGRVMVEGLSRQVVTGLEAWAAWRAARSPPAISPASPWKWGSR